MQIFGTFEKKDFHTNFLLILFFSKPLLFVTVTGTQKKVMKFKIIQCSFVVNIFSCSVYLFICFLTDTWNLNGGRTDGKRLRADGF